MLPNQSVDVLDYCAASGEISNRRVAIHIPQDQGVQMRIVVRSDMELSKLLSRLSRSRCPPRVFKLRK